MKKMTKKRYKVLDLFCGCGGLSRGFIDAGFEVVAGVDNNQNALDTFMLNHENAIGLNIDLSNHENITKVTDYINGESKKIDVIIGGPPCQGFSLAGPRMESDERNSLYTAMVKLAEILNPQVVVLENVPGLIELYDGKAAERIHSDFEKIGYKMQHKILYAPEYGIPQIRRRVFFIGIRGEDLEFNYPTPILTDEADFVTCSDAISDLPSRENEMGVEKDVYTEPPSTEYQKYIRDGSKILYNHLGTNHIEKTKKLIAMVPEGKNFRALPERYSKQFKYNEALTRYHSQKPSLTINTGHRSHFHYKYNRVPSVRENARLQSFKDTFIFTGPKTDQYKLVGNAVPPLLGYHLALEIKKTLSKGVVVDEI